MMLRQGVKVCAVLLLNVQAIVVLTSAFTCSTFLGIREVLSYLSSTPSIIPNTSSLFYLVMSKERVTVRDFFFYVFITHLVTCYGISREGGY